jgi:CHAT domain-containing protein
MQLKHRLTHCYFIVLLLLGLMLPLSSQYVSAELRTGCPIAHFSHPSQLIKQGTVSYERGQFTEALDCWQRAGEVYQRRGDRLRVQISQINQAQALRALGLNLRACQTLLQAFELKQHDCRQFPSDQKSSILQTLRNQPNSVATVTGLRSLAELLRVIGNLELSHDVLQLGLEWATPLRSPQDVEAILLSLGNTEQAFSYRYQNLFLRTQKLEDAIAALKKTQAAIEGYQQAMRSTSPVTQIQAQLNQLNLLIALEAWLQEIRQQPEIQSHLQPTVESLNTIWIKQIDQLTPLQRQIDVLNLSRTAIEARIHFAHNLSRLKQMVDKPNPILFITLPDLPDWQTIAQQFAIALRDAQTLGDRQMEAYALGYLGQLYQQAQQWAEAENLTQQAAALARSLDAPGIAYRWEAQLGEVFQSQGKTEAAIAAYRAAVETLKSVRGDLLTLDPDIQFSFREDVEPIYRKLIELLLPTARQPSSEALTQVLNTIDGLQKAELEDFLQCNLLPVVSVETVVEQVDLHAAVIYPIILENRLEIIVKLPNQPLRHQRTAIARRELEATVQELRTYLKRRDSGRDFEAASSQVYDWLIRPIAPYLTPDHIKTLVFVLDGPLRNVPMAVLYRQEAGYETGRYLVQDYAIATTPGLSLLGPKQFAPHQFNGLIAGLTQPRQLTVNNRRFQFPALPNVQTEVQAIAATLPRAADTLLDQTPGRQFTANHLRRRIQSSTYPIVHLATHGQFSSNPQETFIVTAADEPIYVNDLEDFFQVRKEGTPDTLELIVLSACRTAEGDDRATLGMAGVAVRSGASSTLASLWSVDDRSTTLLMTNFYQTLVKNLNQTERISKAEVLRRAQLQLLQSSENNHRQDYSHPYYWAPFVLVGNWL